MSSRLSSARPALLHGAVYLAFAALLFYVFAPYLWLIFTALSTQANLRLRFPAQPTLANIIEAFTGQTLRWTRNSFVIASTTTLLALAASVTGGYALSRGTFRGKATLMYGIILTRVIPSTLIIVPVFGMMLWLGLLDTHLGLVLVYVGITTPFNLWIMKGAIDAVPVELEEAAQLDGASRLKILGKVVLPLIVPGIGAVGVLSFDAAWGGFIMPLVLLSSTDKYPVSVGMFTAFGLDENVDFPKLATMCLIYMLPVIILYFTVGAYFRKGLASIGAGDR